MAAALVGGAALGAAFGELLKAVLEIKNKAMMFEPTLIYLRSTLVTIAPVVTEIQQLNADLGRPKEELELLIRDMQEGTKLVYKCSIIHRLNYVARVRYQKQLAVLADSLVKFFIIDMQAQTARDQKETLLKVRRIYSVVNKVPLFIREDTRASSTNSAEQVVEPIVATKQEAGQIEAEARNNQGMKRLVSGKSCDQLHTIGKKFLGGVNHQVKMATCIKQNDEFYTEDDKTSYNVQVRRNRLVFLNSCGFDLVDLLRASNKLLGVGSYGITYKSTLEDGSATVVVKRLRDVNVSETKFKQQVEILQTLLPEHPNVCPLRAYYCSSDKKLLIYDYIAGGSFSALMHEIWKTGWRQLDWESRMKISLGAARGIAHIHFVGGKNFVHGNIKSSNVLVTADFQGCISDFGLTSLLGLSIMPSGNKGYQAPEVVRLGTLTQKSDVYSFGVLLLEMLTGRSPLEDPDLPSWVDFQAEDGLLCLLFDKAIEDDIRVRGMGLHMMRLARACASRSPKTRPSMDEVVRKMEMCICTKQNTKFYIEDDITSYNEQVPLKKLVFLDSSYSFDHEDLLRASAEVLRKGSRETTYKAIFEDGSTTVAVKRLSEVRVSKTKFEQQVEILQTSLPHHTNVCPLRAYYYSSDEILLIYDYLAGGSFSAFMHERWRIGWTQLDWNSIMKISLGAARGIAHIHSVSGMDFVHGNIRSSNVLVTADFQGCISEFGLTRLLGLSVIHSNKGYQAPEVIITGELTQKSDVYSFGIILLEMLTGKSPMEVPDLPSWVNLQDRDGRLYALFDDAMKDDIKVRDMGLHMMRLARACASRDSNMRPSMDEVVRKMSIITSN